MHFSDFDRLTQLIFQGVCDDHAFTHVLAAFASAFRCASAAFIYSDQSLPAADIQVTYGPFSDPVVRARYLTYAAEDPAPLAMAALSIGKAASTNQLFSREYLAQSRFLHEFYRPLGFEEALGGPVVAGGGRVGIVAIHRGPDRAPFTDDEAVEFGRLLSHFAKALTIRRTFFATLGRGAGLRDAMDHAANGILVFDRGGGLLHANTQARDIMRRNDGLSLTRVGSLRFSDPEADRRFRAAVNGVLHSMAPSIWQVRRGPDARPYVVRVMPLGTATPGQDAASWVVFVSDPDRVVGGVVETLEAALGVSRRAAALVAGLMAGHDLAGYAARSGISRNTAKFHLDAVFAATGLSRQSDVVQFATRIVHDLGAVRAG